MRAFLLERLADLRAEGGERRFHFVRDWYRWSADQGLLGADDHAELLYELIALRIPGNAKGEAVLSKDPEEGPIDDYVPRIDCVGTEIEEYAYHFSSRELLNMVKGYVATLGVVSHRTGKPLHVTPRRLRYRFATKSPGRLPNGGSARAS